MGSAPTGGAAKLLIERGGVQVNGIVERRRGRQLRHHDRIRVGADTFVIRYPAGGP